MWKRLFTRLFDGFWAHFPQKMSLIVLTPERPVLGRNHILSHKAWISAARLSCALEREKKDRTGKKSQKGYISPIWGEAPTQAIYIKNCVVGDLLDIITCAKFQNEIFRSYHFTGWSNFPFSYWYLNAPYNSAALLRWLWSVEFVESEETYVLYVSK